MRPEATHTAVVVPVGAAEPFIGGLRARLDVSAVWGVPAHVTVVYPFVPPDLVDADVLSRLARAIGTVEAFTCTFTACRWFADDVLWLAPDPARPFVRLTEAVTAEFPSYAPYGGAYAEVIPHLTVGDRRSATIDQLVDAEAELGPRLPFVAGIDRAVLLAGSSQPQSWRSVAEMPLSG